MNRAAYHDAARGMYRRTKLTSKDEFVLALRNVTSNTECEDDDVIAAKKAVVEVLCDLEGPAVFQPELSAFDRRVA